MAVPKKKRYKQVVKHRRTLQKNTLLLKKNLTISKFTNYANNTSQIDAQPYCNLCKNKGFSNNICEICYVDSFLKIFLKKNSILIRSYFHYKSNDECNEETKS